MRAVLLPLVLLATGCAQILDYEELTYRKTNDDIDDDPRPSLDGPPDAPTARSALPAVPIPTPAPSPVVIPHATTCGPAYTLFCDDFQRDVVTTFQGAATGWEPRHKGAAFSGIEIEGAARFFRASVPAFLAPSSTQAAIVLTSSVLPPRSAQLDVTFRMRKPSGLYVMAAAIGFANDASARLAVTRNGRLSLDEHRREANGTTDTATENPPTSLGQVAFEGTWVTYRLVLLRAPEMLTVFADDALELQLPLKLVEGSAVTELRLGQLPATAGSDGGFVDIDDVGIRAD